MTTTPNSQIPIIADAVEKKVTRAYDRFFEEIDELIRSKIDHAELEEGEDDDIVDDVITMLYHRLGVYNALTNAPQAD